MDFYHRKISDPIQIFRFLFSRNQFETRGDYALLLNLLALPLR